MRLISYLTFCSLIILALAVAAHSQVAKSDLIGEVRDQNDALVPNAKVSLTEVATGQTSSKVSPDGSFIMTNLKPGIYNVAVEADGFKQSLRKGTILGGWELAGVIQLQSGMPLAVTQVTNFNAFAGFGTQRPNLVADPNLPSSERTTARFFDTSAFTTAPQFTIGNSSRNPVHGPQYRNADIALIKRTYFGENRNIEFRAEVFNVTNTPPLSAPATIAGAAGFGSITSAGDPRVLQFGLKLNF